MKKMISLIFVLLLVVTGCGEKENIQENENTNVNNGEDVKNIYKSVKTGIENKYTYTYADEATCVKEGNNDHFELIDNGIDVMMYGCEEIEDSNGNRLWGVIFYNCPDEECVFYY